MSGQPQKSDLRGRIDEFMDAIKLATISSDSNMRAISATLTEMRERKPAFSETTMKIKVNTLIAVAVILIGYVFSIGTLFSEMEITVKQSEERSISNERKNIVQDLSINSLNSDMKHILSILEEVKNGVKELNDKNEK